MDDVNVSWIYNQGFSLSYYTGLPLSCADSKDLPWILPLNGKINFKIPLKLVFHVKSCLAIVLCCKRIFTWPKDRNEKLIQF